MKKKWALVIILCILFVMLDQIAKYCFYDKGILSEISMFTPMMNDGISRGISLPMRIILLITVLCIALFVYLFHKKYIGMWEFVLLLAGTLGNLIDRLRLHGVRDFISIGSFPVFNIADALLTCGVILICIKEFFHLQNK